MEQIDKRGKHEKYRHLFLPSLISKAAYEKYKTENPDLVFIVGEELTDRQVYLIEEHKREKVKESIRKKMGSSKDEIEKLRKELSLKIEKEESIEKLTPLAKKLLALNFDVIGELVDLYKQRNTKNNEKIRILELMAEYSYQKSKPADTSTGPVGPQINVQINTYPELKGQPAKVEVLQTERIPELTT